METKKCNKCGEIKPVSEYYRRGNSYRHICKICNKEAVAQWRAEKPKETSLKRKIYRATRVEKDRLQAKNWRDANAERQQTNQLRRLYGITFDQFTQILESQNNCCAICKSKVPGGRGQFHVDHDHLTGKIRGILCSNCNLMLGLVLDSTEILDNAIKYLNRDTENNLVYVSEYISRKYHYADMLEAQDCKCLICGLESQKLYTDHDHATDKIRGLICHKCNTALGNARDDQDILRNAANYLEANK